MNRLWLLNPRSQMSKAPACQWAGQKASLSCYEPAEKLTSRAVRAATL
jgi:hypothetical protein